MKKLTYISIMLLLTATTIIAQQSNFPKLTGPYLGQKPPGMTPEIFAPGIVSKEEIQAKLSISSDGSEIIYEQIEQKSDKKSLFSMKNYNGIWSEPEIILFSNGEFIYFESSLSPDGMSLYCASNRPSNKIPKEKVSANIWRSDKIDGIWTEPVLIGPPVSTEEIEAQPFYSTDNKLYFGRKENDEIYTYYSQFSNGNFQKPVKLEFNIPKGGFISGVTVSPDNKVLLCHSNSLGGYGSWDLFVSFKDISGVWGKLINMGEVINTSRSEGNAKFSPDGKYLFYTGGNSDIYWVDTKIIEEFIPKD